MLLIYMKRFKIIFRCSIQFICNSRCGSAQCNFYQQYVQKIHYRCQALPGKVQPCKPSRGSSINLMGQGSRTKKKLADFETFAQIWVGGLEKTQFKKQVQLRPNIYGRGGCKNLLNSQLKNLFLFLFSVLFCVKKTFISN